MQRFYFVLFLLFFIPISSFAQVANTVDSTDLTLIPESPAPNQAVTVKIASYSIDLNRSTLIWSVDGKQIQNGVGLTEIKTVAPANGKSSIVSVIIRNSGRDMKKSIEIRPGDVSIAWEVLGNTPPLFKGKILPSYQGSIKYVAMPELYRSGKRLDPQELIYTWKNGSTVLGSQSGYGKQSAVISGTVVPESLVVSVDVQSKDGISKGSATIATDFYDPEVRFYKEDPLYGVLYNKALQNQEPLTNNEFKVVGIPFNFSDIGEYKWSINGVEKPDLAQQKSITFRNKGTVAGSSAISLELKSATRILQYARNNFTVYFSNQDQE